MLSIRVADIVCSLCRSLGEPENHSQYEYDGDAYCAGGLLFNFDTKMSSYENDETFDSDRIKVGILAAV